MNKTSNDILPSFAWAGGIVLLALAARWTCEHGYVDHDTVLRVVIGANGLMVAYFGNRAPKSIAPSARAQQVSRFAGWSMVLSGLVYAGFWAFAPIPLAMTIGTGAVAMGIVLTAGYCLKLRDQGRQGGRDPA